MAKQLMAELSPQLKSLKPEYTVDADYVRDAWVDQILAAIRKVSSLFTGKLFEAQVARIANRTVSRADADNAEDFKNSVNQAVGIPFEMVTKSQGMTEYLSASVATNVNLIKSIPEEYFKRVESIVLGGMQDGLAPTSIAKQIQEQTGVSYNKAKFIARDQLASINSDLTRKRQAEAGIEFYESLDAGDERVSGNPAGHYPNAKISCWGIARQDIGYGKGIYKVSDGAPWKGLTGLHPGKHHPNCRCVAIAMIEDVNYFPEK